MCGKDTETSRVNKRRRIIDTAWREYHRRLHEKLAEVPDKESMKPTR